MKNTGLWIMLIIFSLIIGFLLGYIVAMQNPVQGLFNPSTQNQSNAVGSYKTDDWNGKSSALVIKQDGTCLYPTRKSGTWVQEGLNVIITLNYNGSVHNAELVEGGIILYGKFLEKVN